MTQRYRGPTVRVAAVAEIAAVTGELFGVTGTDLGIMWDNGSGETLVAFGDTYGSGWVPPGAGPDHADWRCNVLGASTTRDLDRGLEWYPVVTRPDGTAGEFLHRDRARLVTVIPTAGIEADGVNYVHYMAVRRWGPPGQWTTSHAGIAVSRDRGRTWLQSRQARWPNRRGRHPFQLGAFARDGEHVYLLGTPNGRFGPASLARVDPESVSDVDAYGYWTGEGWVRDAFAARPVFDGPVGELSVLYQRFFGVWLATYLDERRAGIVLRSAERLTGPWSEPVPLVSGRDHPGLYGAFLHPWAVAGPEVYFTMSQWGPYRVLLFRATLDSGRQGNGWTAV